MILGKSIRIYLKDGTVSGLRQAEVVNHTIQVLACPRNKLSELNKVFSKEANRPGVYFLLGDEDSNGNKVYIGEAENVWERLKNHDTKKDFWNEVLVFTSKDENLTKSHVKYLESRLINITLIADRYKIENSNSPTLSSLPLADQDSMEDFVLYIKLLTGTLGHKFLEDPIFIENKIIDSPSTTIGKSDIISMGSFEIELNSKGLRAKGLQTNEGIVVFANSEVSTTTSPSNYTPLREKLIKDDTIQLNEDGKLFFTKNYLFESPSAAGAVILGYNVNGRKIWKNRIGQTLREIEEMQILS